MKQKIEIEVPEGKKAIWKNNQIIFEDVDITDRIKTVDDAIEFIYNNRICEDIYDSLIKLSRDSFEWKIAAYRAIVAAVTYNEQRHLTTGEYWFPSIEFCRPGKFKDCYGDTILGRIKSEGEEFDIVGGSAASGSGAGLGSFRSHRSVSTASSHFGFRAVGSKEAALYISKQFGKLLFEITYGGTNCDWKWI